MGYKTNLTIVEGPLDGEVVDIGIRHGRHLRFLNGRNASFRMQNKYRDVRLPAKTVNRCTVCMGTHIVRKHVVKKSYEEAHLPVSPLVAPTTVSFSLSSPSFFFPFLLSKKNSNRFPSSCSATSLKANVGPWNSSSTNNFSLIFFNGVTSGCLNEPYDLSISARSSLGEISSSDIKSERTSKESSWKDFDAHLVFQSSGSDGMCAGMYKPPSGAKPVSTVWRECT